MTGWTEERVARLRELVDDGLTAEQIRKIIGVTRNAVIGKMVRCGFQSRNKPFAKPRDRVTRKPAEPKMEPPMPDPTPQQPRSPVHMLDLTLSTCRFPMWGFHEEPNFLHCGAQVAKGSVYCAKHGRVCYQTPQPHRKRVEVG